MIDLKTALAILATAALLAVAGCGSSGGDDAAPTSTTPAAEAPTGSASYVRAAWDVCDGINSRLSRLAQPATALGQGDAGDTAAYLERVIAIRRIGERQLADVDPPADAQGDYDRFVVLIRTQTDSFQRLHDAMGSGDRAAADTAQADSATANREQNAIARRLGIDGCAGG